MQKFETIWDSEVNKEGESIIIKGIIGNQVYKLYDIDYLCREELEKYVNIQNKIAKKIYYFKLKNTLELENNNIGFIKVNFLLNSESILYGSDIKTGKEKVIVNSDYIKGDTLGDFFNKYIHTTNRGKLIQFINEITTTINDKLFEDFNLKNKFSVGKEILPQINGTNIKILSINEEGGMDIMVTDIASSIKEFVNDEDDIGGKVEEILDNNNIIDKKY